MQNNDKLSYTLRQKIENFWYHHRFATIAVCFVVFVLLWTVISSIGKGGEEAYIGYIGEYAYSHSETQDISEKMSSALGVDFDGDGKTKIEFVPTHYYSSSQIEELSTKELDEGEDLQFHPALNRKNYENFEREIENGSVYVWFVSKEVYESMDKDLLMPISDVLGYELESGAVDEYAVDCSSLSFSHDTIRAVTYNTYLVMRGNRNFSFIMGQEAVQRELEQSCELFRSIVKYKKK